jgi:GTPase SAR1 family protein
MAEQDATVEAEINKTISLLQQFGNKDLPAEKMKKLILLIGISGSGKSTLTSYLAGDKDLIVYKDEGGDFSIRGPRIGNSRSMSETFFPELVKIDANPPSEYYLVDCPGFGDTRSPSHDIAATVFIKTLLEKAELVKFGVVTVWDDFMGKGDRWRSVTLMQHINTFLNPAKKLENNFGVIVNIVPHGRKKKNIINTLQKDIKEQKDEEIKEFINIITNNSGAKMEVFHKANQAGNMNDFEFWKQDKERIFELFKTLEYFDPKTHEFGSPIHANTKLYVNKLYNRVYRDMIGVIAYKIADKLEDKLEKDDPEQTNFYKLVATIAGLNVTEEPRSNLLPQLQSYDSEVAKDLHMQEEILKLLKQLTLFDQEKELNGAVKKNVQSFQTAIKKSLGKRATSMYDSIHQTLTKCFEDFLKTMIISTTLPPNYEEMKAMLFEEIEKSTNITNRYTTTGESALSLLQQLDSAKYKESDKCNSHCVSLDKIQQTSYVDENKTKELIEDVKEFLHSVEGKVITWIAKAVWTKFIEKVDTQVSAIDLNLQNKLQQTVKGLRRRKERRSKLERYHENLKAMTSDEVSYEVFQQKLTDYFRFNSFGDANLTELTDDYNRLKEKKNKHINELINEPKDWGRNLKEVQKYVENAAPSQPSFINAAVKWVKSQIVPLLPGNNGRSHDVGDLSFHIGDVNPTLLLMDLVVRQFTGTKSRTGFSNKPALDDLEVQAHTLNIIEECEACQRSDDQVDFVGLQVEVHKRLSQLDHSEDVSAVRDECLKLAIGPKMAQCC